MTRHLQIALVCVAALLAGLIAYTHVTSSKRVPPERSLVIYGTSEEWQIRPALDAYRTLHPGLDVRYFDGNSGTMYEAVRAGIERHARGPDLVISSAMDLQVKLVNDGYAQPHRTANAASLPPWARWRYEAFGLTFEPAVMVFNRTVMAGRRIPRSRADLQAAIDADPAFWHGRVGTYDARRSAAGYLLATRDTVQTNDYGALVTTFGTTKMALFDDNGVLLDRLQRGDLAMGYNVLSSYTRKRIDAGAPLVIVYPTDYTLAVLRTAIIPVNAAHPAIAHDFLEFLLSRHGQRFLARNTGFHAIREDVEGAGLDLAQVGTVRPIPLSPVLLVYLDAHKRRRMLRNWTRWLDLPPS